MIWPSEILVCPLITRILAALHNPLYNPVRGVQTPIPEPNITSLKERQERNLLTHRLANLNFLAPKAARPVFRVWGENLGSP